MRLQEPSPLPPSVTRRSAHNANPVLWLSWLVPDTPMQESKPKPCKVCCALCDQQPHPNILLSKLHGEMIDITEHLRLRALPEGRRLVPDCQQR